MALEVCLRCFGNHRGDFCRHQGQLKLFLLQLFPLLLFPVFLGKELLGHELLLFRGEHIFDFVRELSFSGLGRGVLVQSDRVSVSVFISATAVGRAEASVDVVARFSDQFLQLIVLKKH